MIQKRNIKNILIGFISICIIIGGGYYFLQRLMENMFKGERHVELDKIISKDLLDSSAVGLERFYKLYQHYPSCEGKYFFDSIKTLIQISNVYVYADSVDETGKVFPIKDLFRKTDYLKVSHTYLGAGLRELTVIYHPISKDSYQLYSVGENYIDENGKGDDVVYK